MRGEQDKKPELGILERIGAGWGFRLWDARGGVQLRYADEEAARRGRGLMQEALKETALAGNPRKAASDKADSTANEGFRHSVHTLLEEGSLESLIARLIEGFLVLLIVGNVASVALESIPSINTRFRPEFAFFERASLIVFTLEYVLRVWSCVDDPRIAVRGEAMGRLSFVLQPLMIVDFLAFAPSLLGVFLGFDLRVLRIFRLFRLLKLARYSQALQALLNVLFAERSALLASAILLLAFTCLSGEMMHLQEGDIQPGKLGTMPLAMYWALTTLTTVGYGDVTPITPLGKLIAGLTMVMGLAIFSLPIGIIANGFVTGLSRRRFAITWNMLRHQPLFESLDIELLTDILEVPTASIVREHAHLITEGQDAGAFYLIVSGSARVEMKDGERLLGPGDMAGPEALIPLAKYSATVAAETDLRVMVFPPEELRRLCRKIPDMRRMIDADLERYASGVAVRQEKFEDKLLELQSAINAVLIARHVSAADDARKPVI
jgi:voltage-gated potassium channel